MTGLEAYLRPMPVAGESLRFDLSTYRSTATRQMLQVRMRLTAQAFGVGSELIAANVTPGGSALEVDADTLLGANAEVRSNLEVGPEPALTFLRGLTDSRMSLDRVASAFGARISRGMRPGRESFVAYVRSSGHYQALGALKFCLPDTLRPALAAWMDDPALVEAMLSPEAPSLWSVLTARELALARVRVHGPASQYRRRLARHRREFGYLFAEDVDFRAHESLEAIDARLAALGAGGSDALAAERRRLARALAGDRACKLRARQTFVDRLDSQGGDDRLVTLFSHVLLARALAAHEDRNRRAKMRLLRDLRDLAEMSGVELERASLTAFAAACPSSLARPARKAGSQRGRTPIGSVRPVLRST